MASTRNVHLGAHAANTTEHPSKSVDVGPVTRAKRAASPTTEIPNSAEGPCDECEKHPAALYCTVCSTSLCAACKDATHASKTLRGHEFAPLSDRPVRCAEHNKELLEVYCVTDHTLLCPMCAALGPHKSHQTEPVETAAERVREQLRKEEAELGKWQGLLHQAADRIRAGEREIEEETGRCLATIGAHCDGLVRLVRERQLQLAAEVKDAQARKTTPIRAQERTVAHAQGLVKEALKSVRQSMATKGSAALLRAQTHAMDPEPALVAARQAPLEVASWLWMDERAVQQGLAAFRMVGDDVPILQWVPERGTSEGEAERPPQAAHGGHGETAAHRAAESAAPPAGKPAQPVKLTWDRELHSFNVSISSGGLVATMEGSALDWKATCISGAPCDDASMQLVNRGASGDVMIGLINRSEYMPNTVLHSKRGAYFLYCKFGRLYGPGHTDIDYHKAIHDGSVVRCAFDRAAGTINFHVDGVDCGVAFRDVPAHSLLHPCAVLPNLYAAVALLN